MYYYGLVFEIILSITIFLSFEHQGSNNKNWIHSPDTLLNGHVVYLVKVRNYFFTLSSKETLWLLWINIRFQQGWQSPKGTRKF